MIRKLGFLSAAILSGAIGYTNFEAARGEKTNECSAEDGSFKCVKYVSNYDGDTFTVIIPRTHPLFGYRIPVRIAHIDTAELDSKDQCEKNSALLAKEKLASILSKAKRIDLIRVGRDKYFRILAEVRVNDATNVGGYLVKEGLAVEYEGGEKPSTNWCVRPPNSMKK